MVGFRERRGCSGKAVKWLSWSTQHGGLLQVSCVLGRLCYLLGLREEGQPLVLVRSRLGLFCCADGSPLRKTDPSMAHVGIKGKVHGNTARQECREPGQVMFLNRRLKDQNPAQDNLLTAISWRRKGVLMS